MEIIDHSRVYVAFLDILGFKDLIEKNNHKYVANLYDMLINQTVTYAQVLNHSLVQALDEVIPYKKLTSRTNTLIVSDSIILWSEGYSKLSFNFFVINICMIASLFFEFGLPLRGAISIGNLSVRDYNNSFNVFGKGIIQAHNLEKEQEWSGIVIDKRIIERLSKQKNNILDTMENQGLLCRYKVPFKEGLSEEYVVNWSRAWRGITQDNSLPIERISEKFNCHNKSIDSPSIQMKINNTKNFISFADSKM